MVRRLRTLLVLAGSAALLTAGDASAENIRLNASVGPGFSIRLLTAEGNVVQRLEPGTYDIVVRDLAEDHNFHLQGPGVDERTGLEFTGTVTWTVTLRDGVYTFVCDPHAGTMRGSFRVGEEPPPPRPPLVRKLVATVGPAAKITLRDAKGAPPKGLTPGTYVIVVRDRSKLHNVHLVGAGINRKTTIAGARVVTWRVGLKRGTLRFFSDAAPKKLRGAVRIG